MELGFEILAEFLVEARTPLYGLLVAAVLVVALVVVVVRRLRRSEPSAESRLATAVNVGLGVTAGLALLVVLGDVLFHEQVLRHIASRVNEKPGIEIAFERAEGSALAGRSEVHGVSVRLTRGATTTELELGTVAVRYSTRELLEGEPHLTSLVLRGISGRIELDTRLKPAPAPPKRPFVADAIEIHESSVRVVDVAIEAPPLDITVSELRGQPFHSDRAHFDLLYRTDTTGTVDGRAVTLTARSEQGRLITKWVAEGLPLALLGRYGRGPLAHVEGGKMELELTQKWEEVSGDVHLTGRVGVEDLKIVPPDSIEGLVKRTLFTMFVERVTRKPIRVPIDLKITDARTELFGFNVGALVWRPLRMVFTAAISRVTGLDPELVEVLLEGYKRGLKAKLLMTALDILRGSED